MTENSKKQSIRVKKKSFERGPQQSAQRAYVSSQCCASAVRHSIQRDRFAKNKFLLHTDIARFFQFRQMRAQVSIRRTGLIPQPGELRIVDTGQQREDGQPQLAMDYGIEFR